MIKTATKLLIVSLTVSTLYAWDISGLGNVLDGVTSALKVADAAVKAAEDITPEQEYYIGRAVSATILKKYKLYKNDSLNDYISKVGLLLSLNSKLPYTYGGYSFAVLDSDEINAFAAPSGMIFITKGMLRICDSEDALAAVLAHEIAHVQNRHGIRSIEKGRITSFLTIAAGEGAKQFGGKDVAQITKIFEDSINDIVNTMVTNGYSRAYEYEADKDAIDILKKTGYENYKMLAMLENMKQGLAEHSGGFNDTHPAPQDRIDELVLIISDDEQNIPTVRTARFAEATKKL